MLPLEQNILRALAWFSLFEYSLTAEQVHGQVGGSLREVRNTLPTLAGVVCENGLYRLRVQAGTWEERLHRLRCSARKLRRAKRMARYLSIFPWVRAVAACNSLGFLHTREESDVDLFVIVRRGSIWLTRFLAAFPLKMLRWRPEETAHDPICLSFFLSDHALNLSSVALPDGDPYLAFWMSSLHPLYDRDEILARFQKVNTEEESYVGTVARVPEWIERAAERLQRRRFPESIKQLMYGNSAVVANNDMLKFHTNDRRILFRDLWQKRCTELGV